MWHAETQLVPEVDLTEEQRSLFAPMRKHQQRQDAIVEFALGNAAVEIAEFTHREAHFVDIYATVRTYRPGFRPEHVFGLQPEGIVLHRWEGRGLGATFLSTMWLLKPATPRRPARHIVWTLVWQPADGDWKLVGSHASSHE